MGLTRNHIKILALIFMLIDHLGLFLFDNNFLLRAIGRLSFPLFVFLLVDGFYQTRNLSKYAGRLALFWLISVVPYSLAMGGVLFYQKQNIFATLFLGLVLLCVLDNQAYNETVKFCLAFFLVLLGACLSVDYGWYGILLFVVMYNYKKYGQMEALEEMLPLTLVYICLNRSLVSMFACFAICLLPINGEFPPSERPGKLLSYCMYLFYPIHLLFFAILTQF